MQLKVKNIVLLLTCMLFSVLLKAQNNWVSKGTLYEDKNISVEIEYLMPQDGADDVSSYFRYRITRLKFVGSYYINWRFDFFNFDHELKTQLNSLHIVKDTKPGIIVPLLNSFRAKQMSNYYNDVRVSVQLPEIGSYKPVSALSMEPVAINGVKEIVSGGSTTLSVKGGSLAKGSSWMWYEGSCSGKFLGSGASVTISPERTINVFVKAVGIYSSRCFSTEVVVKQVPVVADVKPVAEKPKPVNVIGTYSPKNIPKKSVPKQSIPVNERYDFIVNGGVVFNEVSDMKEVHNYMVTVAGGGRFGWFARAKLSDKKVSSSFNSANNLVTDYDVAGYYRYNGEVISKRSAYTGGVFFGGYTLSGYVGGGYGSRELLWGIDQYAYNDAGLRSSVFAKNNERSYKGAEIELGLMLRLGFLNIMGGASSIQFKYTDFNAGVGLNF